jgi:hypothetical protein
MNTQSAQYTTVWDNETSVTVNCVIDTTLDPIRLISVDSVVNDNITPDNVILYGYITYTLPSGEQMQCMSWQV